MWYFKCMIFSVCLLDIFMYRRLLGKLPDTRGRSIALGIFSHTVYWDKSTKVRFSVIEITFTYLLSGSKKMLIWLSSTLSSPCFLETILFLWLANGSIKNSLHPKPLVCLERRHVVPCRCWYFITVSPTILS